MKIHPNESIDAFESVFKRSLKEHYKYSPVNINSVLLLFDEIAESDLEKIKTDLRKLNKNITFDLLLSGNYDNWSYLKDYIFKTNPDLIVSERLLNESDKSFEHSLGVYISAISQYIDKPLLILPDSKQLDFNIEKAILVGTEHNYVDNKLIDYSVYFAKPINDIFLIHVEDKDTFDYYMNTIEKVPEIYSESSKDEILKQLLKAPKEYMESVKDEFKENSFDYNVNVISDFGHVIDIYKKTILENKVGLLIFESKDDTQMAMHSLGYSMSIEFKDIPVLLL